MTKVLENIDTISKEEVIEAYNNILNNSKKALAIVGALDKAEILPQIEETFGTLPASTDNNFNITKPVLYRGKQRTAAERSHSQSLCG